MPNADGSYRKYMVSTPAVFIGHGNPVTAIEPNRFSTAWGEFAAQVERPKAILAISAHWFIGATAVTAMENPRTIHDFYGFPDAMFQIQYPAPGNPRLAERVVEIVNSAQVSLDKHEWGLDHGTWSPLLYMYPDASIPVVQLSLNGHETFDYHFNIGMELAALSNEGVMVIASGNVVHNLSKVNWGMPNKGFDWAHSFDEHVREIMLTDPARLVSVSTHRDFRYAAPTPDHFIPLLYTAGIAVASGCKVTTICEGYDLGSLSMTSYRVG
jgi:4,5-DOPA dioxygenase extradiol